MSTFIGGGIVAFCFFILIGIPFLLGYQVKCGRNILKGDNVLPEWHPLEDLIGDGIKSFIIKFLYGIVLWSISFLLGILLGIVLQGIHYNGDLLVSLALSLGKTTFTSVIGFAITMPIIMMEMTSLMIFIDSGDLGKALNPSNALQLLKGRPREFAEAAVLVFIIGFFIITLPFLVFISLLNAIHAQLSLLCIAFLVLVLVAGWFIFFNACVEIYIWASMYKKVTGAGADARVDERPAGQI